MDWPIWWDLITSPTAYYDDVAHFGPGDSTASWLASRASLSPSGIITSIAGQERKAQERTSLLKNYGALPSPLTHLVLKVRETEKASGPSQEDSERVGGRRDAQDRNNQEFTSP